VIMTGEFSVAVHALVYLNHMNTTLSSAQLADNICTNPARVRKIMAELVKSGLAVSGEGRGSGYAICENGPSVTLLEVLDALGDRAVSTAWRTGDMDRECLVSSGMGDIMDSLCEELNDMCRQRLSHISIGDINDRIFGKNKEK